MGLCCRKDNNSTRLHTQAPQGTHNTLTRHTHTVPLRAEGANDRDAKQVTPQLLERVLALATQRDLLDTKRSKRPISLVLIGRYTEEQVTVVSVYS